MGTVLLDFVSGNKYNSLSGIFVLIYLFIPKQANWKIYNNLLE